MFLLIERLLETCVAPWWRGTAPRWSLAWGAMYAFAMATAIVFSRHEPLFVIGKRVLALHAAFAFAAFFGSGDSPEEQPRGIWERTYAASISLLCLMVLAQAAFAFTGVRWGVAWLAGGLPAATDAAPVPAALLSLALGLAVYVLMAIETRAFRGFLLRVRRQPMPSP